MTDREYLAEAREWLEEVKKLAGLAKDEKWYQKRLNTLQWLIEQAEKADRYESELQRIWEIIEGSSYYGEFERAYQQLKELEGGIE